MHVQNTCIQSQENLTAAGAQISVHIMPWTYQSTPISVWLPLTSWVSVSRDFPRLILWLVEPCLRDLQVQKRRTTWETDLMLHIAQRRFMWLLLLTCVFSARPTCAPAVCDAGHWEWSVLWLAGPQRIHWAYAAWYRPYRKRIINTIILQWRTCKSVWSLGGQK